jgi:hypothetical protein
MFLPSDTGISFNQTLRAITQSDLVLNLSEISLMSTDLGGASKRKEDTYSITLYGPFCNQTVFISNTDNVPTEMCSYAPLKHLKNEWYEVTVTALAIPTRFVRKYNNQLLLRLKLVQ